MRFVLRGLGLSSALALGSCGGDGPTEAEASLTREEALALVEVSTAQGFEFTQYAILESETTNSQSSTVQLTAPCPMGGTVAVNGQANFMEDPESERFAASFSMTLAHSGCVARHEATGIVFTLDGAPDLVMGVELSITGALMLEFGGSVDGTLRWATDDDRSGSCRIDLDIGTTMGDSGLEATLNGEACGTQIMESESGLLSL